MEYKAYSFDLDDNLLKLPTVVYLKNEADEVVEFSTLDFEKLRPGLKDSGFRVFADSFKAFHDDAQFLRDIEIAVKAGSWDNLVNCVVEHASVFAIITARGHSPVALRNGLKAGIIKNFSKLES